MCPTTPGACCRTSTGSRGNFGYFPSYALGSAYGAQAMADLEKTIDFDAMYAAGDLAPLRQALTRPAVALRQPEGDRLAGGKPVRRPLRPEILR